MSVPTNHVLISVCVWVVCKHVVMHVHVSMCRVLCVCLRTLINVWRQVCLSCVAFVLVYFLLLWAFVFFLSVLSVYVDLPVPDTKNFFFSRALRVSRPRWKCPHRRRSCSTVRFCTSCCSVICPTSTRSTISSMFCGTMVFTLFGVGTQKSAPLQCCGLHSFLDFHEALCPWHGHSLLLHMIRHTLPWYALQNFSDRTDVPGHTEIPCILSLRETTSGKWSSSTMSCGLREDVRRTCCNLCLVHRKERHLYPFACTLATARAGQNGRQRLLPNLHTSCPSMKERAAHNGSLENTGRGAKCSSNYSCSFILQFIVLFVLFLCARTHRRMQS